MVRRVAWVTWQAVFLLAILVGFVLAVQDRRWVRAALFAFIAANVVWSLNWLPGQPGRLRRLLRRHRLRAENPAK